MDLEYNKDLKLLLEYVPGVGYVELDSGVRIYYSPGQYAFEIWEEDVDFHIVIEESFGQNRTVRVFPDSYKALDFVEEAFKEKLKTIKEDAE